MNVEFKNVNQGDSIFLSWLGDDDLLKYGIIDCHEENGNPILNEIKNGNCKEIEFILITHPHFDHFSGFIELLNYCKLSNIIINNFCLTFNSPICTVFEDYYSYDKQSKLYDLLNILHSQMPVKKSNFIKNFLRIDSNTNSLALTSKFSLHFRAPHSEIIFKLDREIAKFRSSKTKTKPDLNSYSTILEIELHNEISTKPPECI